MARTPAQLKAWALLLEVCEDECATLGLNDDIRSAIIEVERELNRLHKVERYALTLARLHIRVREDQVDDDKWEVAMDELWTHADQLTKHIEGLVPEAFTPEAMCEPIKAVPAKAW